MPVHVILGRGATAQATARLLAEAGDQVRVVSRSGGGPAHPLVERIALDANDADRLTELTTGAATLVNCAMPAYHTWPQTVPPLFRAVLSVAERTGAGYVMLGNLYGYGPVDGPVTEDHPLAATGPKGEVRARMWREAKAAHDAGRVRVTEVRAGQFIGPGAFSTFTAMVQPRVLAGRLAVVPAALDAPHSYTSVDDAARALVAVARDQRSLGQAWHAPVIVRSVRQLATRLAELAGAPAPRLAEMTDRELTLLGATAPVWDELWETHYMSHRPFVVDSTRIETTFGLTATPLDDVLDAVLRQAGEPAPALTSA
ncbi:NAD-dependent epimerase/dehydratase family protein [Kutzneria kofuensis]|uniref:Nucleoside-diphosphate-sugar epimerase n=1 Tax=Kutzneria kofuensis TaxID=103725 RepID=A0A7W9KSE7_9PSEU|nr:NAD-dependent epimerase/dehydratase family protein [Kutzneria kofuensis]MBB5897896.1 nucleoside-diphosphate-sugar epimerase [Kutzneria kofuensis]